MAAMKTPVTMLSGFLGAGKTTVLRYVLENSKEKIACIVNDVASVNIDAKLVRNDQTRARENGAKSTSDLADTIELANGCACCNIQDELFASFEQIIALSDKNKQPYARIILENSGVAEPQAIRDKFKEAQNAGHPLMERISLDTLVTVVDCGTFLQEYASKQPLVARPDLGDGGNLRPVVDLLVEQIECADFVILNKTDTLNAEQLEELSVIVTALNPMATVIPCQDGKICIDDVFGKDVHSVVAHLNIEGQHRGAVAAAMASEKIRQAHCSHDHDDHEHSEHEHHHHDGDHCCHEHHHDDHCSHGDHDHEKCGHDHHEHSHNDEHSHEHKHGDHEHHDHEGCELCAHGHDHEHAEHDSHDHHHHKKAETRAAERFGIRSFVYSRRRPFHPQRLKELVLQWLPVATNAALDSGEKPAEGDNPVKKVLRSKGFMWMSNSHNTAYYWSHAGSHFDIRDEGDWWASVEDADWPTEPAMRDVIFQDFDKTTRYGDRRQEIVFIGAGMEEAKIVEQLDAALLADSEMELYTNKWASHEDPEHDMPAAPAAANH